MTGEIIKIDPLKKGSGGKYIRVHFKMVDGRWAKTDLVINFRNFRRWERLLRVGNIIGNLRMKDEKTVDADSWPLILLDGKKKKRERKNTIEELAKMGVFG